MSRAVPRFKRINPTLPPLTGNVVQLTIFGTIEVQITLNILYYQDPTGTVGSIANLNSFMSAWSVANALSLAACASADWTLTQFKAQYVNLPTIIPQYLVSGQAGTGPAGHEPTTVAGVVSKATQIKGQSGRGRFYIAAIPTAVVSASAITGVQIGLTYQPFANKLNNVVVAGGLNYTPGIFSRRGYNKITGLGGGFSAMSSCTAKPLLGTVRRRRIGRGK